MVRWLSGQKLKINFAINNDRIFNYSGNHIKNRPI